MIVKRRYTPSELQGSATRHLTPVPFARLLVAMVRDLYRCSELAVLYCDANGPYMWIAGVNCWTRTRDASLYGGPHPVIAHPPCGPWGRCSSLCKYQWPLAGTHAIEMVHRWGGVVEQPEGSKLFELHGRRGASIMHIDQADYGHRIQKPTLLYFAQKDGLT